MISVSGKNWEEISINKRLVEKIKIDHNFSEIISKLIVERNYSDKEIYSLNNDICFSNPFLENKDFISAVDLLKLHLNKKSKFLVIGDYDVDGCVSTSLIINFLNKFSVNNTFYIPDRVVDGYGANINLIKKLINKEIPDLIIMVDCGSNSKNIINFLNKNKIDTIIIDHHNINHPYPKSNVLINPKKKCDYSKYDYYCSAFLTFLFLDLYIRKNRLKININNQLIYVALATIADVMPLRENNRFILKKIVENFDINKDLFLNTLFKLNNLNKKLDYEDLAYIVAPTINSAGRISNANIVVELLTTSNKMRIKKITNDLFAFNLKRKKIEKIAMKKF